MRRPVAPVALLWLWSYCSVSGALHACRVRSVQTLYVACRPLCGPRLSFCSCAPTLRVEP